MPYFIFPFEKLCLIFQGFTVQKAGTLELFRQGNSVQQLVLAGFNMGSNIYNTHYHPVISNKFYIMYCRLHMAIQKTHHH